MSGNRNKGKGNPDNNIRDLDFAQFEKSMKKELTAAIDPEGMLAPPSDFLATCRAHGAALAHEAIAWHGKARLMAFLRRWKGRDEEAIAYLLPAFAPDDEDDISPANLNREYGHKELTTPLFQNWATAFQQEQARGLYEALTLLIPTEDETGREIHPGPPLDEVGALLAPDNGEQT